MKGKLPWWLVVILGWIVLFAGGAALMRGAATPLEFAKDTPGLIGGAWYLVLLGGTFIALGLAVAIARALASLASKHRMECALAIIVPPLVLFLYNLYTLLPTLLRR
jgi:hypothetical protein